MEGNDNCTCAMLGRSVRVESCAGTNRPIWYLASPASMTACQWSRLSMARLRLEPSSEATLTPTESQMSFAKTTGSPRARVFLMTSRSDKMTPPIMVS
eukprot:545897-Pyramimonas_sp.AAC.1